MLLVGRVPSVIIVFPVLLLVVARKVVVLEMPKEMVYVNATQDSLDRIAWMSSVKISAVDMVNA